MFFVIIVFFIDVMLFVLIVMGEEFSFVDFECVMLVVGIFVLGMGIGMFFVGFLLDVFGRKFVILGGYVFYIIGVIMVVMVGSFEFVFVGWLI